MVYGLTWNWFWCFCAEFFHWSFWITCHHLNLPRRLFQNCWKISEKAEFSRLFFSKNKKLWATQFKICNITVIPFSSLVSKLSWITNKKCSFISIKSFLLNWKIKRKLTALLLLWKLWISCSYWFTWGKEL